MPEQRDEGTPDEGLPWGFILDPAANAQALGDVQRRGRQAARDLVDRVISNLDPAHGPAAGAARGDRAADGTERHLPLADLLQACWELAAQLLGTVGVVPGTGSAGRPAPPKGPLTVNVNGAGGTVRWPVQADVDGRLVTAPELWIANPGPGPVGPLHLGVGDLRTSDGAVIGSDRVAFDPAELAGLPPRSARGVAVTLSGEDPLAPGTYRGVVQAEGAPNLWVGLEIDVGSRLS